MPARKAVKALPLLLLLLCAAVYLLRNAEPQRTTQTAIVLQEPVRAPKPVVLDAYGLVEDDYRVHERRVQRSQTFSEILGGHHIDAETIHRLVSTAEPVFDVRRIRAGDQYRLYLRQDTARYLVYRHDAVNYVVFDLQDSLRVTAGARPVQTARRTVQGTIRSSLYSTLSDLDADPTLALQMAEMYAWQIDFYRIQPGDEFQVHYEEQLVDGKVIGLGDIIAARFNHVGEDYYGFRYGYDGFDDYFDERGHSLRKAFLKSPLKFSRITSHYSKRRFHPVQKRYKPHLGTDYGAAPGTPILSVGDGVVVEAQYKRNNGNYVKIRHNGTYTTGYLHMSKIGKGIKPGARVRQGDVIGYVGSTGLATGPHVCFRFWKKGAQVNHLKEEIPPSNPIPDEHRLAFEQARDALLPHVAPEAAAPALARGHAQQAMTPTL